jgi:ATP-dependent RNA helicase DeaD
LRIEVTVSGFEELHLSGAVGRALEGLGWQSGAGMAREAAPTAARGHNLVLVTPPAAAYAGPALAGVISRLAEGGRGMLLCPAAEIAEWAGLAQALAAETSLRVQAAQSTARALRRLRAAELDLLVCTPETALALQQRAALKLDAVTAVVFAWPERWDETVMTPLMQDLAKDAQRVVVTAAADRGAELVERYARKALTVGAPPAEAAAPAPAGPVRTVSVAWNRRAAALAELVEMLDPATVAVWTADRSHEAAIRRALPASDASIRVTSGDVAPAQLVIAFDPPGAERLAALLAAGDVVLLVPPGTEGYIARVAAPRRPLRLPGLNEAVADAAAGRRATIAAALERGTPERGITALAPLLERYDASAVAAALYELWIESGRGPAHGAENAAAAAAAVPASGVAKLWVGVGKKDGTTPADIVAVLTKEVGVNRTDIGRIELRDAFALVEVPAASAEEIAAGLSRTTIRRRRVTARLDRGGSAPRGDRPERSERPSRPRA